ncbi:MAG: EamA family transporter [Xanthomonadales bacterium]|nr:EamA family transporter [Xanthomonadales bacterium]|tara:strand:+ start:1143 stop:2084 length:942 start_codon:yes stop_codon:yes gene_type:complete
MTSTSSQHLLGVLGIVIAAILWGTTGTAATFAPGVGPLAIGAAAMGIGGLLQTLIAWRGIQRGRSALLGQARHLLLGGVAVAIYPLAFYSSMDLAGVAIGTVVTIGSAPLLSALIEWQLDNLRLTRRWFAGSTIGLLGMALLCFTSQHGSGVSEDAAHVLPGILAGLVAGLSYAVYSWAARRIMQSGVQSSVAMGAIFGLGGALLMPVLFVTGGPFLESWRNFNVGVYMALVPMFIGYVCFGFGLARVRASAATTITLLEPVVAAILAIAIVGEMLSPTGWAGVALIITSLVVITAPIPSRPRFRVFRTVKTG